MQVGMRFALKVFDRPDEAVGTKTAMELEMSLQCNVALREALRDGVRALDATSEQPTLVATSTRASTACADHW